MDLEVGMILEGKVTGITKFGAFVDLEDGKTGMVHISEVAPTFVNNISDHLKEGQTVKVKVLNIGEGGKISLSIKKAMTENKPQYSNNRRNDNRSNPQQNRPSKPNINYEWQPKRSEPTDFEDMMSKFKQTSEEKISNLKRTNENRRGSGYTRRNNNSSNKS